MSAVHYLTVDKPTYAQAQAFAAMLWRSQRIMATIERVGPQTWRVGWNAQVKRCPTCGSKDTPSNPVDKNGRCKWCLGTGDYADPDN